jgi:predicted ribosomally synthesized peptide with SipW-like signal peptide
MKRKAILSLMLVAVLMLSAGLGTYAWFSSSATSANNTFTAGTLKLRNEGEGSFNIALKSNNIQPGDILTTGADGWSTINIINDGSLPMATFGRFTLADVNNKGIDFAKDIEILEYKVNFSNNPDREDYFITEGIATNSNMATNMYDWVKGDGPLDAPNTAWDMEALKPGESLKISFKLGYDKDATIQGQKVTLGYEVKATQVNLEALNELKLTGVVMENHIIYLQNQVK